MRNASVLAAIGLTAFLAGCGDGSHDLTGPEKSVAEVGALKYFQASGNTFISCSGLDSNSDKYVTCTGKDKESKTVEIVCSYTSEGCKQK